MSKGKIPGDILGLLNAADKKNGFPIGTMASVMQQEIGGQMDRFLGNPSEYHYPLNDQGKRIAKHTGKVSTAFGPFGILESTGRDPGYGVKPLQSKDLGEQIRFASEYLAARSKGKGLVQGLAGYGEGAKYAEQVAGRVGKGSPSPGHVGQPQPVANPVVAQATPANQPPQPQQVAPTTTPAHETAVAKAHEYGPDPWAEFAKGMPKNEPVPAKVAPEDIDFPKVPAYQMAQLITPQQVGTRPTFDMFGGWGVLG